MPSFSQSEPEAPKPVEDPLIGLQVGEYRILEPVGEGGMGVVYRGVQPVIKKKVAIKIIKPAFAADESQVNRLVAEAEAVNAIGHRSIIDIFSLGRLPDGRPYIIMEFLDGEPLDVWLNRHGRPPLSVSLELLVEMCGPLAAAHRAGVIHRDLKPSNVFLCSQPDGSRYLKLLDFGLAKRALGLDGTAAQTSEAMVSGTPDYMAPEQARGLAISPRSDIYALGIVAFELLTGRVPFIGATPMDVMVGHVSKPAPRLRTFEPALPAALDELLARMLAKEPEQRPQTIEEVRAVLEEVLVEGGDARPRPSQTKLARLSGLEPPRPATPSTPLASVSSTPLPLPEPLPVVVGTVLESATHAPAEAVVVGTALESRTAAPAAPPPSSTASPAPTTSPPPTPAMGQARVLRSTPGGLPSVTNRQPVFPPLPEEGPSSGKKWLLVVVALLLGGGAVALWKSGRFSAEEVQPPPKPAAGTTPDTPPKQDPQPEDELEIGLDLTGPAPAPGATDKRSPRKKGPPTAEHLLKRISRFEEVAKKKNLGPSATSLLDAYRLEATAVEAPGDREALSKKLDSWQDAFLGK
ncbi:MAG: serine/threonine protein kinase [Myxococcales bacterium]|nr:serine/threonine protein kinase [Myxococcales bacterium]